MSDEKFDKLWADATIVVDANTLLNFYRYTEGAREAMFRAFEILRERLWVPHQVAKEFHTNRPSVIRTQEQVPAAICESLDQVQASINSQLGQHKRNGVLDVVAIIEKLTSTLTEIRAKAESAKFGITPQSDTIVVRLADILETRVGDPFKADVYASVVEEGQRRIAEGCPPGLKDAAKSGDRSAGDYILWRQLMNHCKSVGCDALFITDDRKDDWWWTQAGYTMGPLPALREEFERETGQFVWFYRPARFLAELRKRNLSQASDEDISAVRETSALSAVRLDERPISASSLVDLEARRTELLLESEQAKSRLDTASAAYAVARRSSSSSSVSRSRHSRDKVRRLQADHAELLAELKSPDLSVNERDSIQQKLDHVHHQIRISRVEITEDEERRAATAEAVNELESARIDSRRARSELAEVERTLDRYYLPPD